ncbi:AAA family ATPase [Candidatus Thiothrix anitrata]|uniref:AAA family ATPase n=2 Tax=Thiothrix TaxID=1030 RepID=A0ABY3SZM9_9GAMM|nr:MULTISPECIES: AAA family ATPase [Thiothrix]QTR50929.1 AAA family ATPase [Candidatus Thiothrix anitrata]UJS24230.1 AAA family ATPase [Thiothrix winogradskyi]
MDFGLRSSAAWQLQHRAGGTAYIAKLEEHGSYHFLLRPRRFGKSLFISMLEHYFAAG